MNTRVRTGLTSLMSAAGLVLLASCGESDASTAAQTSELGDNGIVVREPTCITGQEPSEPVDANIIVESGGIAYLGYCPLDGTYEETTIRGNVKVKPGGRLQASTPPSAPGFVYKCDPSARLVTIEGNVQADASPSSMTDRLTLACTDVQGHLRGTSQIWLGNSAIGGNVMLVGGLRVSIQGDSEVFGHVKITRRGKGEYSRAGLEAVNAININGATFHRNVELTNNSVQEIFLAATGSRKNIARGHLKVFGNEVTDSAEGPDVLLVTGWEVYGNVELKRNRIEETIDSGYTPAALRVEQNTIWGHLKVFGNEVSESVGGNPTPELTIVDNTVGKALLCKGNEPAPMVIGNTVEGRFDCAD